MEVETALQNMDGLQTILRHKFVVQIHQVTLPC